MACFLLVHGAFHGAWCWEQVVPRLQDAGHEVQTLDLPGAGEDPTPAGEVTLEAYARAICERLAAGEPALVVGHSMGGMAITQAAGRCSERIAGLVYVAAFLPQDGQSLVDLSQLPEGEGDQVQAHMVVEGDPPTGRIPLAAAPEIFYNCTPASQAQEASSRIGPQPLAPLTDKASRGEGFESLPRAYIACLQDRCIMPALQRHMYTTARCEPVIELDTDHSPMLSRPRELTEALLGIAAAWER